MASKPVISDEDPGKNIDDDFVILETFDNMADSGTSSASTIPEKQTYESLEKLSDSFNSLGDSMINEQPYYESSRFIEKQLGMERKRGFFGEGEAKEKSDESCDEKGGSGIQHGKGVECKEKEDIMQEGIGKGSGDFQDVGVKGGEMNVGGGDVGKGDVGGVDAVGTDIGGGNVGGGDG